MAAASAPRLLFCLFLFSAQLFASESMIKKSSLILPLKAQKLPPGASLLRSRSKLRFHHNVSLTVTMAVGTPPQNVSMVLDTGSGLSWLLCSANDTSSAFRPIASSSYRPIPCSSATCREQTRDLPAPGTCSDPGRHCHVSLSYADASSSEGTLASDNFRMAADGSPAVFGCMSSAFDSSGNGAAAAGLLGMNRASLSFVTQTGTRRFSYCISDRNSSGVLLIGGDSAAPSLVPLNYTPLISLPLPLPYFDRVAYSVQLEGIRVGGVSLPIPKSVLVPDHTGAGQTMVDSGTQFTFLLGPAYAVLKSHFISQTKRILTPLDDPDFVFQGAFDTCFKIRAGVDLRKNQGLPEVAVVMRGAEVRVKGERLLYRASEGIACLTFGNSDLVPIEAYVIGHHHQTNVWVEYDLDASRVGFGPVQCDVASQRLGLTL